MKKIIAIMVVVMAAAGAYAQSPTSPGMLEIASKTSPIFPGNGLSNSYANTIEVTGRAEKEVVPNEIYLSIVIDEAALKQKQSVEQLESEMIKKLKSLGINTDEDLKIGNMSSGYMDYFFKKNAARTSATYQLKVGSVQTLGKVFQSLEGLGISNMNISKLSHTDMDQFQNELRVEALKNAQQIAGELAKAVGQSAGRAVQITDYNNDLIMPVMMARDGMFMAKASGAENGYETPLEFKNIKLTYSVQAKFALQ